MKAHEGLYTGLDDENSALLRPNAILREIQQKGNTPEARNEGAREILDTALDSKNEWIWARWMRSRLAVQVAVPCSEIYQQALDAYKDLGTKLVAQDPSFIQEIECDAIQSRNGDKAFAAVASSLVEEVRKPPAQTLREAVKRILDSGKPDYRA